MRLEIIKTNGVEMGPVAVRALCDDAINEITGFLSGVRQEMKIKYSNRSRLVNANERLLKSVISNLILNAIEYNDKGLKTKLDVCESRGKVKISVRDFGPALPLDIWQKVNEELQTPSEIAMRPGSSALGFFIASRFSI